MAHGILGYLMGLALLAAPFVLGFTDDDTATPTLLALGVIHLLQTLATRFVRARDAR